MTSKATLFKRGGIAFGALGAVSLLAIGAGALGASAGPAIPSGKTIVVPKTHVQPSATINLKTFNAEATYSAVFAGDVAAVSTTGAESVSCSLTIGSPARIIGSADQIGTGTILNTSGYPTTSMAITGTFTAQAGETLALVCTTTTASDAIINVGHVVLTTLVSQTGGV